MIVSARDFLHLPVLRFFVATALTAFSFASAASAGSINASWSYELSVLKDAPTLDAVSKLVVSAAGMFGPISIASGVDTGTIDNRQFNLQSTINGASLLSAVYSNLNMTRRSQGKVVNGINFTQRYTDKRGNTDELSMTTDLQRSRYEFFKAGRSVGTAAISYAACDLASLPYAYVGRPAPTKTAFVAYTDGRAIRSLSLNPSRLRYSVDGQELDAVKLSGSSEGATVELWLRASDSFPLRMRVGLGAKYGAVLDQKLQKLPANSFTL